MPRRAKVIKHLSKYELIERYKIEKDARIKRRLLSVLLLYEGVTIKEVAELIKRCEKTVGNWLKGWNNEGCKGLKPNFTGGQKPKISNNECNKILEEIEDKGMAIKDVVKYGKPYIMIKKRPENTEEILKKDSMRQFQL